LDQECLGYANVSTTCLYDRRRSRPEDSPQRARADTQPERDAMEERPKSCRAQRGAAVLRGAQIAPIS
jgi:hypothetical protein